MLRRRLKLLSSYLFQKVRAGILHEVMPESQSPIFVNGKRGIEVVGLFRTASGIGEAARLCVRQLDEAGYKVRCVSVEKSFRSLRNKPADLHWDFVDTAKPEEIGCRVIHLNPSMMPLTIFSLGLGYYKSVYNIGCWAWELEEIPREWQRAIRYVNAILCPSDFTSNTIRKYTDKPVMTVPHPVKITEGVDPNMRQKLNLSAETFLVSNIFSFGSAMERKNPVAAIDAFIEAFAKNDRAVLVLKSNSGGDSPDKKFVLGKIRPHQNIRLIDDVWSRAEILGLMKTSNVYISLHRSEGFGLPIAEAMVLGTPVIATNWSGNTDFCKSDNSYLVNADMISVDSGHMEFRQLKNLKWANPHVAEAAQALRRAYQDPAEAKSIGQRGHDDCVSLFSGPLYATAIEKLQTIAKGA